MKRFLLLIMLSLSFIIGCREKKSNEEKTQTSTEQSTQPISIPKKDSISDKNSKGPMREKDTSLITLSPKDSILLLRLTDTILTQIKAKSYSAIAKYIDPVSGVRFSPYAYVDTLENIVLSKEKFLIQSSKSQPDKILWGEIDPTEEPIKMTLAQYMEKFVYDVDFAEPEKRSVDKFLGFGNSLNNLSLIYKGCHFTESYFSGFEKKYEGLDWRTLRLVFKERGKKFYLIGIVHDQWTI